MAEGDAQSQLHREEPFDLELACVRYLDDVISEETLAQLNAALARDVEARNTFVEICVQTRELREMMAARSALAPADFEPRNFEAILTELANQEYLKALSRDEEADTASAINEAAPDNAVGLPAGKILGSASNDVASGTGTTKSPFQNRVAAELARVSPGRNRASSAAKRGSERMYPSRRFLAIAAVTLLAASIALVLALRSRTAATLTGIAGAKWAPAEAIATGTPLQDGKLVHLASGAVELKFASGASVVVEGPAAFRVAGRNEAQLEYGKMVAHVPAEAHGFTVHSSSLNVTDLGTEFGLEVTPAGTAQVEVFTGVVEVATAVGGASSPTRLSKGQAASCDMDSADIRPVVQGNIAFARSLSDVRVPLVLHGTGVAATEGGPDPYWRIVSESARPAFVARPAVAVTAEGLGNKANSLGALAPNDPPRSKWISDDPRCADAPTGLYIFTTSIDLTGVDPKTAEIQLRFWVDDELREIRVNGKSNPIPNELRRGKLPEGAARTLAALSGLKAGMNDIEFVVWNDVRRMAFRVAWDGTAMPLTEK